MPTLQGRNARPPTRRRVWLVLLSWTAIWSALATPGGGYSWHYFAQSAELIAHPDAAGAGLHLFARHPELQFGPVAMLAAVPLNALGPVLGRVGAQAVLALLGLLILHVLSTARQRLTGSRPPLTLVLSTGLLFLPVWCLVAVHFTHLDDALALGFVALAVLTIAARRPNATALLLAAAIDSKPWALGFAALTLVLPRSQRLRAAVLIAAGVALSWLPFLMADTGTIAVGRFSISNVGDSALNALGVHTASTPGWDRPAQILLGVLVAVICVRRGRWVAVPLAVIAARLLLDPQTYPYYSSGLLVATVIVDLLSTSRRLPVWSAAAAGWVIIDAAARALLPPAVGGDIRAVYCAGVLVALTLLPPPRRSARADRPDPDRTRVTAATASTERAALTLGRPAPQTTVMRSTPTTWQRATSASPSRRSPSERTTSQEQATQRAGNRSRSGLPAANRLPPR